MQIKGVASLRNCLNENFRDIVYEWENEFLRTTSGELYCVSANVRSPLNRIIRKISNKANSFIPKLGGAYLAFCMNVGEVDYYKGLNILPVFIDVWPDEEDAFYKKVGNQIAVVTSLDMYNILKKKCPNILYMPLCISDIWISDCVPQKRKRIVQMGRNNRVLHEFALRYTKDNPSIEYIYAEYDSNAKRLSYFSTIHGQIQTPESRKEYMEVLQGALICLLSSPGIDDSRPMARGIDYPTPRFYETAINYCHMLSRYNETHEEFEIQSINDVCTNIKDYKQFKMNIDRILGGEKIDKEKYDLFIKKHLTSTWSRELIAQLQQH